ncbi:MAG: nuclear transport factor 2 family protein [Bacteroidetes bacterium]|nr:nuclear transport factor 2 family protein [Bacteroidota bacterium]MDA1120753.1 nuclear transport factor 2 family protein [Bacteroidota bacterium]
MDKRAIVQNVTQMLNDYHKDIGQKGLTAEFDYLDQSADFFWVPPGYEIALSYDSVRNILEGSAKAVRSIEFHWDTLQIFPLSNEIANYSGIVSSLMIDTAGIESKRSMIESGTIIKRENGWKLLSGQSRVLLAE